nr:hypothetical protein [Betaproteobacteria bacterium]
MEFRGIVLENQPDFSASVQSISRARLDEHAAAGNVLVHIAYSTINYKDGLALTNKSPVVRKWPMVPGIDGAGVVEESDDPMFPVGSSVILNGFGVGETHWGCLAAYARLKAEWLIPMPAQMDARTAMIIGTAGYTAMLCLQALEQQGLRPEHAKPVPFGIKRLDTVSDRCIPVRGVIDCRLHPLRHRLINAVSSNGLRAQCSRGLRAQFSRGLKANCSGGLMAECSDGLMPEVYQ